MERKSENPFNITTTPEPARGFGQPAVEHDVEAASEDRLRAMIESASVFMLIKGTPQRPLCGFSANTVALLDSLEVPYRSFDALSDESIRSAAKKLAGWPTFPQVYVRGEFIGGNDIVAEMHATGELQELIRRAGS